MSRPLELNHLPPAVLAAIAARLSPSDAAIASTASRSLREAVHTAQKVASQAIVRRLPEGDARVFSRYADAPVGIQLKVATRLRDAHVARTTHGIEVARIHASEAKLRAALAPPSFRERASLTAGAALMGTLLGVVSGASFVGAPAAPILFGLSTMAGTVFGGMCGAALSDDALARELKASYLPGRAEHKIARRARATLEQRGLDVDPLPPPTNGRYGEGRAAVEALERRWFGIGGDEAPRGVI